MTAMKKLPRKLALHKDTVRQLATRQLPDLHGGAPPAGGALPREFTPFPTAICSVAFC
jgi:hypothetical protein